VEQVAVSGRDGQTPSDHNSTTNLLNRLHFPAPTRSAVVKVAGTQAGVSRRGSTFRVAYGQRYPIKYYRNANPSKGRKFRDYTDSCGAFHDID